MIPQLYYHSNSSNTNFNRLMGRIDKVSYIFLIATIVSSSKRSKKIREASTAGGASRLQGFDYNFAVH